MTVPRNNRFLKDWPSTLVQARLQDDGKTAVVIGGEVLAAGDEDLALEKVAYLQGILRSVAAEASGKVREFAASDGDLEFVESCLKEQRTQNGRLYYALERVATALGPATLHCKNEACDVERGIALKAAEDCVGNQYAPASDSKPSTPQS